MVGSWRNRAGDRDPAAGPVSWRKAAPSTTRSRYWQGGQGASLFSRWQVKLAILGLLTAGLIGALVSLVLRWDVRVPVIALSVCGFDDPIPPNALAWEDLEQLRKILGTYDNVSLHVENGVTGNAANLLSTLGESLRQARMGGPNKDTIIVYLSSHGVVNERNEPCLLVDDSTANDTSSWLPMQVLLQTILDAKPTQARLLLLLDSGKLNRVWPMGIVHNTFAERLTDLIEQNRAAYPRLAVINSNSIGQACQLAPELGTSAFGFFVAAGLGGDAAGNDDLITLAELRDYLQSVVDRFAREQRSSHQMPRLVPAEPTDFSLTHAIAHATGQHVPSFDRHDLLEKQPTISELWKRYDALLTRQPQRMDPVGWGVLRRRLLRLDALLTAGSAYADQLEWTISEVRDLLTQFESSPSAITPGLESLASVRPSVEAASGELAAARQGLSEWKQLLAQSAEGSVPSPPSLRYPVAATLVWDDILSAPPSRAGVSQDLQLLPEIDPMLGYDYPEIQYLRLLLRGLDWPQVSPSAVTQLLQTQAAAEQAAALNDSRCLAWVAPELAVADDALRRARDQLFVGTPTAVQSAQQLCSDEIDYPGIIESTIQIAHAYALRDTAWADGPYYAQWLLSSPSAAKNADLRTALIAADHRHARIGQSAG